VGQNTSGSTKRTHHTLMTRLGDQVRFEFIFQNSGFAMALIDPAGQIIEANHTLEKLLGYGAGELTGVSLAAVTHPDDMPREMEHIRRETQASPPSQGFVQPILYQDEKRFLCKDGSVVWAHLNASFIRSPEGTIQYGLGIVEDITEHKRAEAALQESEARFRAVVEDQTELICRYLPDTTLTFVNTTYCRFFGKERRELFGRPFLPMVAEQDRDFVVSQLSKLTKDNPVVTSQHRVITTDGSLRWMQWTDRLIMDNLDRPLEYQSVGFDITHSKQAYDLLQVQRDLASALSARISLPEALDRITSALISMEDIDGAAILLVDRGENRLVLATHQGLVADYLEHLHHTSLDNPMGQLILSGKPSFSRLPDESPEGVHLPALGEGGRATIIVPVMHEGQVIASLNLASAALEEFPFHVQNALEAIAAQTAQAIIRMQAEEVLQTSQRNLQTLFESLDDFILILDQQGSVLAFNPVVEERLGYPANELYHRHILSLHPPDQSSEASESFTRMLAGQQTTCTIPLMTRHGTLIPVETRATRGRWNQQDVLFNVCRDTTQRLQAEQALHASEMRFKALFERARVGISLVNLEGRLLDSNPAFNKMTGFSLAELRRLTINDYTYPEDIEPDWSQALELFAGKREQYQLEKRMVRKDGSLVWVNLVRTLVRDAAGRPQFVFGMAEDITERKQAEEALRTSEMRYRTLMEMASDAIFLVDALTGNLVDANQKAQALTGRSLAELTGIHHTLLYPVDVRPRVEEAFSTQLQDSSINLDLTILSATGRWVPVEISARLIHIDGSQYVLAICHDLSERRQMEAALQASEDRYRTVVEGQTELICRWRPEGVITFANQAFRSYFNLQPDTLTESSFMPFTTFDDLALFEEHIASLLPSNPVGTIETRYRFPSGDIRWLQWTNQAIYLDQSNPVEIQSVGRDITERVTVNQALQSANERLTNTVAELEMRHAEAVLLNKMGDILQSCLAVDEVYRILAQYAPQLFPGHTGAIYIFNPDQQMAEMACTWGAGLKSKPIFTADQCWALRRGRKHIVLPAAQQLTCAHLLELPYTYLCVPLNAQGQTLGLFYLENSQDTLEQYTNLATIVSERIALALANLRLSDALRLQAIRDPLTDLYNRRYMEETLDREMRRCQRKSRTVGVIMVDIDDFKKYNTLFFLDGGDAMLVALGRFLKEHIRRDDVACRYGGDEFVLILPEASIEETYQRAEFIRQEVKKLVVQHRGQALGIVTFSLGVAAYPEHASTAEDLLHAANVAAFKAKTLGNDQVVVASSG
jgi:diguanylate cyclase (GGDEF)-like protein/PAS domain S-box-containing protein